MRSQDPTGCAIAQGQLSPKDPVQAQHKRVGGQKGGNRLALCSANL